MKPKQPFAYNRTSDVDRKRLVIIGNAWSVTSCSSA
jgi:hypothetical protein